MTVTIEEAEAHLKELIHKLAPGEELVITENDRPVAKLVGELAKSAPLPRPGLGRGSIIYMAPDFDESYDFRESME